MLVKAPGTAGSAATGTQLERTSGSGAGPSRSDFLRLLTEQLRHQDPLNPMEDTDMMSQLAQFSALEETQGMRAALDRLAAGDQVAQAAALLGKSVTGTLAPGFDPHGNPVPGRAVHGTVSGVALRDGQAFVRVGADELPLASVTKVETATA